MNTRLKIGMILASSVPIILGVGMLVKGQIFVSTALGISLVCLVIGLTNDIKINRSIKQ